MPKLELSLVHDAYAAGGECPVCWLLDKAERNFLLSFQGSRVMEPGVRVRTNETGFCPEHTRRLYQGENKLGLGLVIHTHLGHQLPALLDTMNAMTRAAGEGRKGRDRIQALCESLEERRARCYICEVLETALSHYEFTILYLWRKDPEFHPTLGGSRGFCLSHFVSLVWRARDILRPEELESLLREVVPLMTASLERLERDLLAFTGLHQAGNNSLGSEEERAALARTLQKLSGFLIRRE